MTLNRNHLISSVAATLELLEVLAQKAGPLPMGAFVEATGKPKSSVHRMLATLVTLGFVEQDPETGAYSQTLKMWRLGMVALSDLDITNVAPPHLEALMRATDETVHLSMLDPSGDVVYVAKIEALRSIRVQTYLGKLSPSWCTATGRCILAFRPEIANEVLGRPLNPITRLTVTDTARLRTILQDIRANGYTVTRGENHPEMGGVAAPIRDYSGKVIAACGAALPVFRMDQDLVERCVPLVIKTAADISSELGYQTQKPRKPKYGT